MAAANYYWRTIASLGVDAATGMPAGCRAVLLPSARGDLLAKLGRFDEARPEFERAAALTRNTRGRVRADPRRRRGDQSGAPRATSWPRRR